eukprot:11374529-Prorocentrum_lima.AAC.1
MSTCYVHDGPCLMNPGEGRLGREGNHHLHLWEHLHTRQPCWVSGKASGSALQPFMTLIQ